MLAVQIAAYSSRLADKEEIMQNSHTDGEHVWNGGQIVAWVVLEVQVWRIGVARAAKPGD